MAAGSMCWHSLSANPLTYTRGVKGLTFACAAGLPKTSQKKYLRRAYSVPGDAPEGVYRSTFVGRCNGPTCLSALAGQPDVDSVGATADASTHETDDLATSSCEFFVFCFFCLSRQRGSRDSRKRADASAEGRRFGALHNPRLVAYGGANLSDMRPPSGRARRFADTLRRARSELRPIWQTCHMAAARMVY